MSPDTPQWVVPALEKLAHLLDLPEGWDSYGARAVDPRCALAAIRVLAGVMCPGTPAPSIVPTPAGGVQLEWHINGVDLEIEIETPSRVIADYEILGEETWQGDVTENLAPLAEPMRRLTPVLA